MDDFDTFKAAREKMDPSCRNFSKRQWRKAYSAYVSSRKRVSEGRQVQPAPSKKSLKPRRTSVKETSTYESSPQGPTVRLRNEVRHNSAYGDLRMILNFLSWVAIGLIVLTSAVKVVYYTNPSVALAAILDSATMVIAVVLLRLIAHVIIDIPDIALRDLAMKRNTPPRDR